MSAFHDFTSRLLPGERIVWNGRPRQGLMLSPRDVFLIPFSVLWCAFAVFWESMALIGTRGGAAGPVGVIFPLWGVPFILAGLYVTVGRFFHDAWIRSRISYALTDRRALILRGDQLTVVDLGRLSTVQLKGSGARGTIVLGPEQDVMTAWRGGWGVWLPSSGSAPRFIGIENAKSVFNQIETARAAAA